MNRRPGQVDVVTEVGYCPSCGRTRNLRREDRHLGTLVRTVVTCETCHRTLSSSIGVAAEQPIVVEPEPAPEPQPIPVPAPKPKAVAKKLPAATKKPTVAKKAVAAKKPAAATSAGPTRSTPRGSTGPAPRRGKPTASSARKVTKKKK